MDDLELIEQPSCWNCGIKTAPLYINHRINGDRERAITCLACYKEEE